MHMIFVNGTPTAVQEFRRRFSFLRNAKNSFYLCCQKLTKNLNKLPHISQPVIWIGQVVH